MGASRVGAGVVAVLLAFGAAACGDDGGGSVDAGSEAGAGGGETRTITHAFGTTEVPVDPQRVVSVGYEEQQMILHFGVVPVLQREYFGEQPFATWPWDTPYLEGAEPEVFTEEMPFERIADAEPDLIMAVNAGLDEEAYERLSSIAPTVAHVEGTEIYAATTEEMFRLVAEVFGQEEEAQAMLDETDAQLAEVAAAHPEWEGLHVGSLTVYDPIINADNTEHARGQLLDALGFAEITEDVLPYQDEYPTVPFEQVDLLDALDAVVWIVGDPTPEVVLNVPLRDTLRIHTEGREIYADFLHTAAFGTLPHQVDFLLEWLVPELEAAIDGDPATEVPSAVEGGLAPA